MKDQFDEKTEDAFNKVFNNDYYKLSGSINKSISKIEKILEDSRNNDPEYYNGLKKIFKIGE